MILAQLVPSKSEAMWQMQVYLHQRSPGKTASEVQGGERKENVLQVPLATQRRVALTPIDMQVIHIWSTDDIIILLPSAGLSKNTRTIHNFAS